MRRALGARAHPARGAGTGRASKTPVRSRSCALTSVIAAVGTGRAPKVRKEEHLMAQQLREIMTQAPKVLDVQSTIVDAARVMRESDIGMVLCTSSTLGA